MRLRTCNKRKARRKRASLQTPFCYILHEAPYEYMAEVHASLMSDQHDLVMAVPKGDGWRYVSRRYCYDIKQQFPSYADAIIWMTKIKLSLTDKPEKYRLFKLAKIVEGYYTKGKRENVTRVTDLTNVSHSLSTSSERRLAKQRQSLQQRQQQLRYAKTVARAAPKAANFSNIWNSWTPTWDSPSQTVGGGRNASVGISLSDRIAASLPN